MRYRMGDLVELVTETNSDLKYGLDDIVGVTLEKEMIPTIANLTQTDLDDFIIVHPKDFVYNPRTHGKKIGLGFNTTDRCFISTWNNNTFHVRPEMLDTVIPEYLYMHFLRERWDKEACFNAWGSSTVVLLWSSFCDMKINVPPISEQRKIVHDYQVITDRIELLRKINENLEEQMDTLFINLILGNEGFDFNEHIDDKIDFVNGLAMQEYRPLEGESPLPVIKIRELTQGYCDDSSEYCTPSIDASRIINPGDLVFSWSGSLRLAFWSSSKAGLNQHLFKVTSAVYPDWFNYLWTKYYLKDFQRIAENKGTTFGHIKREDLHAAKIKSLDKETLKRLGKLFEPMQRATLEFSKEIQQLHSLRKLHLGSLSISNKGA